MSAYVGWLHGLWKFRRIFSDASNHAVNDLLRSKSLSVEPVVFTIPSKVELFGRLKNAMEASRLLIPQHPDLVRELSTFEYRISPSGNLLLHHVACGHDDYPDSLALGARALTAPRRGKPGPVIVPDWGLRGLRDSVIPSAACHASFPSSPGRSAGRVASRSNRDRRSRSPAG